MKKMFALVIMMVLLVGVVPVFGLLGAAKIRNQISTASDSDAGDELTSDSPAGETRYEKCVRLAMDNTGIRNPEAVCERIITRGRTCVGVLEEEGVERPVVVCTRLGLAVAEQAREVNQERREALTTLRAEVKERFGQGVKDVVAEHRLDRVARLQEVRSDAADFVANLPEENQKVFLHLGRAKQKELLKMDSEDADAELGRFKLKVVKTNVLFKRRVIAKENILQAQNRFDTAKDMYLETRADLKGARSAFDDAKKSGDPEAAMEAAKEYLLLAADIEIATLEKIMGKVEASEDLTEDEAEEILADSEEKIAGLEAAKAQVEAATTKEEIQDAARLILRYGKAIEARFVVHVAHLAWRQTGTVIERSAHLEERFDCALSTLEDQGVDTAETQDLMDKYSAFIESARSNHAVAKEKWQEARGLRGSEDANRGEIRSLVREAYDYLKGAHQDLREAHTVLKDILSEVRASGGKLGACAAKDADVAADEEVIIEDIDEDYGDIEVPEEEETGVDDTEEEEMELGAVALGEIEKPNCWVDKPAYTPGVDKGYYIWQGKCANFIWVDWSGDTRDDWRKLKRCVAERKGSEEAADDATVEEIDTTLEIAEVVENDAAELTEDEGASFCSDLTLAEFKRIRRKLLYPVSGRIVSNGKIFDVGARRFDGADVLIFTNNVIRFKGRVGPHFDGLFFRTTGDIVLMELWFDAEKDTSLINIGKDKRHPANDPFKLKVEPTKRPQACDDGQVIYNHNCVTSIGAEDVSASAGETVITDDGSLSDSVFSDVTIDTAAGTAVDVAS